MCALSWILISRLLDQNYSEFVFSLVFSLLSLTIFSSLGVYLDTPDIKPTTHFNIHTNRFSLFSSLSSKIYLLFNITELNNIFLHIFQYNNVFLCICTTYEKLNIFFNIFSNVLDKIVCKIIHASLHRAILHQWS